MEKWIIAALLYVTVVVGGFAVYETRAVEEKQVASVEQHGHEAAAAETENSQETESQHGHENSSQHEHESNSQHENQDQVHAYVQTDHDRLNIFLRDTAGNPIDELEVNHEKLLHLIIVDEHLQKYYHLHPEQKGKGWFSIDKILPKGFYKAFVDIKPKHHAYHVTPIPFVVGYPDKSSHGERLHPDDTFTRQVDGETVTLSMSSFNTNEPVTLTFDLDQSALTPYLGALGHVVILDENARHYLHVHPASEEKPVFETRFQQPGIYKIWAEFKQNGKVRTFPFVVEIKGEK